MNPCGLWLIVIISKFISTSIGGDILKSIKLLLVAFGVMLILGACSNNESQDIEELDVSQESEKEDSSSEKDEKQNSSSGAGGSDSGGSGSPDKAGDKNDSNTSSDSKDETQTEETSTSEESTETKQLEDNQSQEDSQSSESNNTSSNETESSQKTYNLADLNGKAVKVIKGIYAVSVPKEELQNVSKDSQITFKAGGKTYKLKYEKEVDAFANLYIDDNDLETLQKGIVVTG